MTLRQLTSHAEVLEATDDSAFIRYDIPSPLEGAAYTLGGAVALSRRTHTRRLRLLIMGPTADLGQLVGAMLADGLIPPDLRAVTVPRGGLAAVAAHLPLADGNDWEWMYAAREPSVVPAESRLVGLDEADLPEIRALLDVANPRTDARPFEFPDQQWVGARDESGRLVACGVREPNVAGWPALSGISVHPDERGTGLGLAVTAYLTREAVRERGICTLRLYSDNDLARRVYHGLGYGGDHLWSSRRLGR
ncbi:GNAT family N-acetyltransferase [Pedococcus bigeumensis]|uniref:GNAT family N-acetyltransferase n=1 Tax=Pedococcus bigeumensis TaxID=433644 RepID=A0A502D1S7_9MICO|nr:GNAT family N-acetyltransferase [Pedococcus bigeumensis]TPG19715.1 GNAT family N-acetyltransferase [Pedococcus bigeumensis]